MKILKNVALIAVGVVIGAKAWNDLVGWSFAYRTQNPKGAEYVVYEDDHKKITCITEMHKPDRVVDIATIVYK